MPIDPAVAEVLKAASAVLDRWGRWYLFGAQAVVVYGVLRLSADVDVTLLLALGDVDRFVADMAAAGFESAAPDAEFVERTRVVPFVHRATGIPLDVVLAGTGLEDEFIARAAPRDVGGVSMPVISVEDLIIAKILAGRPKDVEDVYALSRIRGDHLDDARISSALWLLEEALGRSDLVAEFASIRRRSSGG